MAIIATVKPDDLQPYTVTRAICMAGERVEVGAEVMLTRVQGTELFHAGKVSPGAPPEAIKAAKAAKVAAHKGQDPHAVE